jgi:hypothetical protein
LHGSATGSVDVRAGAPVDRGGRHAAAARRLGVRSTGKLGGRSSAPETSTPRRWARAPIEAGVVVDVTGTAEPVTTVAAAPVRDPLGLVETHGHAVPGAWLIENPGFVSGGSTLWLAGLLGMTQAECSRWR